MTPPKNYNRKLQAFDSQLRVRWSEDRERWLIERRAGYRRLDLNPASMSRETYIQRRDGYFTLGFYPPRELPPIDRLIAHLQRMDTWRPGLTADSIANQLDADDHYGRERREAKIREGFRDTASTLYDDAHRFWGTRVYPGEKTIKEARAAS